MLAVYITDVNKNVIRRCGSKTEEQNGGNRKGKNRSGSGSYKKNTQAGSHQKVVAWTRKLRPISID
jgi:hypothetical protein